MLQVDDRLTLCMPTLPSRSHFVARAIAWYNRCGARLLVKSSADLSNFECMQALLARVETPYVVMAADDDFFLPRGLNAAVDLLADRPGYALAHGKSLTFKIPVDALYGPMSWVAPWVQRAHETPLAWQWKLGPMVWTQARPASKPAGNDAWFRRAWTAMFAYRPVAYSVMRVDVARQTYDFIAHNKHQFQHLGRSTGRVNYDEWGEFCQALIPHFRGMAGLVNELYLVRQMHAAQVSKHGITVKEHHPPLRAMIRAAAPVAFRAAQFLLRSWPHRAELQQVEEFLNPRERMNHDCEANLEY